MIEDNKEEIGKVISDQSKKLLKSLINRSNAKETISDTKNKLSNIASKNKENINQRSQEMLDKLLYGEGMKLIKNSSKK